MVVAFAAPGATAHSRSSNSNANGASVEERLAELDEVEHLLPDHLVFSADLALQVFGDMELDHAGAYSVDAVSTRLPTPRNATVAGLWLHDDLRDAIMPLEGALLRAGDLDFAIDDQVDEEEEEDGDGDNDGDEHVKRFGREGRALDDYARGDDSIADEGKGEDGGTQQLPPLLLAPSMVLGRALRVPDAASESSVEKGKKEEGGGAGEKEGAEVGSRGGGGGGGGASGSTSGGGGGDDDDDDDDADDDLAGAELEIRTGQHRTLDGVLYRHLTEDVPMAFPLPAEFLRAEQQRQHKGRGRDEEDGGGGGNDYDYDGDGDGDGGDDADADDTSNVAVLGFVRQVRRSECHAATGAFDVTVELGRRVVVHRKWVTPLAFGLHMAEASLLDDEEDEEHEE